MPIYKETQLNRGISANFNSNAATEPNYFWFRLDSATDRFISDINAGYSNSFLNVATPVTDLSQFYFHGRIVIFNADLEIDKLPLIQLQSLFSQNLVDGRQGIPGTILYDSRFVNQITTAWKFPIKVEKGDICNIVMTAGLRLSDTDVFSYALHNAWLDVKGSYEEYGVDKTNFPFMLR